MMQPNVVQMQSSAAPASSGSPRCSLGAESLSEDEVVVFRLLESESEEEVVTVVFRLLESDELERHY